MPDNTPTPVPSRSTLLVDAAHLAPCSHTGSPRPQRNTDPYADLRASALSTLKVMGYTPKTHAEPGVVQAEDWDWDRDPFGHIMHSQ